MADKQTELVFLEPGPWAPPKAKGKFGCGRDPEAGPGSCYHWWDGCPKAEKRGCYILHARKLREQQKAVSDA